MGVCLTWFDSDSQIDWVTECWKWIFYEEWQARIHTGFHRFTEIGQIFHNKLKYIFFNKSKFQVEVPNMAWTISWLNYSETQERGL